MIVFDGQFFAAVDTGAVGGRHSVVRKNEDGTTTTVLLTVMGKTNDEGAIAIAAAMALDAAEIAKNAPKGLFGRLFGK